MELYNKIILVTGASRGIGAAIARRCVAEGAKVVMAARMKSELAEVMRSMPDGHAHMVCCDIRDRSACAQLVEEAYAQYGRIDGLVNNAGAVHSAGRFIDLEDEAWEDMWQVNVMGAVRLSRLVARRWIERSDSGAIVNITSVAGGLRAAHRQSAYGASKAALNSLTQTIAAELGPYGIRVNAIACGLINTRLSAPIFERPSVLAKIISKTPLRRAGVPEEVAEAALFLLGNRSRFTTGQISVIDGGISL